MFDCLLFDLDGTLTDSFDGIANSVIYSLEKLGAPVPERQSLSVFVGPPLFESYQAVCGFDPETAKKALAFYREYYNENGWKQNRVYDGVKEALETLKSTGKTLAVATSKPEYFSNRIIELFGLDKYFVFVAGATLDDTRTTKDEVIAYALKSLNVDKEKTVMIGDRKHDVIGAKQNGLKSIGVLYGYGNLAELSAAGADYIANTPEDIIRLV